MVAQSQTMENLKAQISLIFDMISSTLKKTLEPETKTIQTQSPSIPNSPPTQQSILEHQNQPEFSNPELEQTQHTQTPNFSNSSPLGLKSLVTDQTQHTQTPETSNPLLPSLKSILGDETQQSQTPEDQTQQPQGGNSTEESQNQSPEDGGSGQNNGGKEGEDGEEEEEGECGFCLFMKGGGCKDTFVAWEKCIEEGEKNKEDIVEKCYGVTTALKKCMEEHNDYYAPILRAEKAAEEQVVKELEKQAADEDGSVEKEEVKASDSTEKQENVSEEKQET